MRKISIHVDSVHTSEWGEQQIEAQCESLEATSGNLRTLLFILIMLEIMLRMMMMVSDYGDNDHYCSSYIGSSRNKNSASKWSNSPSPRFDEYFQVKSKALLHKKKELLIFSHSLHYLDLFDGDAIWRLTYAQSMQRKARKMHQSIHHLTHLIMMSSQLLLNYFPRISHLSCV